MNQDKPLMQHIKQYWVIYAFFVQFIVSYTTINSRILAHDEKFGVQDKRLDILDNKVANVDVALTEIKTSLAEIKTSIKYIEINQRNK